MPRYRAAVISSLKPELAEEMCRHNYQLELQYFSFRVLRNKLRVLLQSAFRIEGECENDAGEQDLAAV